MIWPTIRTEREAPRRHVPDPPRQELPGSRMIRELPPDLALPAWMTFRLVTLDAYVRMEEPEADGDPIDPEGLLELAQHLRRTPRVAQHPLSRSLVAVLAEMAAPDPDRTAVARGCLCVAEAALEGAPPGPYRQTALAFVEAAAWISSSARYWFLAGKLHRHHGEHLMAEFFLTQAMELARGQQDRETLVRLRLATGNTVLSRGDYNGAKREFERALRACQGYGLRGTVRAEAHHDLMIVRTLLKDHAGALHDAERAIIGYAGEAHPRIPYLVHDLAWLWIEMRDYVNAFAMLTRLLATERAFASDPLARMMVIANLLWAAAGAGQTGTYQQWAGALDALLREPLLSAPTAKHAPAALAAARGASLARDEERFQRWVVLARQTGEKLGQDDVVRDAAELLKTRTAPRGRMQPPPGHGRVAARALQALERN